MSRRWPVLLAMLGSLSACAITVRGDVDTGAQDARVRVHVPRGWESAHDQYRYAPVLRVDDTVYVSGVPAAGEGSYQDKVRRAYQRIEALLREAGAEMRDVVEITSYHTGPRDSTSFQAEFDQYLAVHREFFPSTVPAWSAVGTTALLAPGAVVEIRVVAVVGSGGDRRTIRYDGR